VSAAALLEHTITFFCSSPLYFFLPFSDLSFSLNSLCSSFPALLKKWLQWMDSVKLFWKLISFKTYTFSKILTEFQFFWLNWVLDYFFQNKNGFCFVFVTDGRNWQNMGIGNIVCSKRELSFWFAFLLNQGGFFVLICLDSFTFLTSGFFYWFTWFSCPFPFLSLQNPNH
jgi:hypothetical protein